MTMAARRESVVDSLWSDKQQEDMDSFINNILTDPPPPPKDAQAIEDIEAFLGDVLATGRMMKDMDARMLESDAIVADAEARVEEMERNQMESARRQSHSEPSSSRQSRAPPRDRSYDSDSSCSSRGGGGVVRDRIQGKTQVFISMHGCPLLKSMLMPRDSSYEDFLEKVETKLNEMDLTLYYEDTDGDKVEIDDDDSVTLFMSQNEKEGKLKIIAFPAELVSTRMARAFATSPGTLSSRTPPRGMPMASARSCATSRGGWQSTMGTVEYASHSPRTAHGRRASVASGYDRQAALSARRVSAESATGAI
eukprot:TRINITY_DN9799_c0_g1_i1.p1 TRINITY_DN9799_c0_g1~~TRINITY_DN9799_c0_g1_i1.p1  ORF type:complete len:309 (+),score=56.64 TRINITY_DN9799_c0_g1_i1:84-1010(+)